MGRKQLEDLIEFQHFMVQRAGISALTASSYASLVRRVKVAVPGLTPETITAHVDALQVRTSSLTKTAWRYYAEYEREQGRSVPNPFAPVVGLRRIENGSALGVLVPEAPVSRVAAADALPEEIRVGLRAFLIECPPARDVLHLMRWEWTRRTNGLSDTAHPKERNLWLPMEPELLHALAMWGSGQPHPILGPLIPTAPKSNVPFPLLPLLRQIEA